jgi:hypothetical protein
MNRTWDENRQSINQLWPIAQFTEEEKRLWNDDLSGLDQDTLYDAIRNAKRGHDAVYPQLKWILDEYRSLSALRRAALRMNKPREEKTLWNIDDKRDRETRNELMEWVDRAQPNEYRAIYDAVFEMETFKNLHSVTATRIIAYAKERLLGIKPQFGKVNDDGSVTPLFTSQGVGGRTPLALRSNA